MLSGENETDGERDGISGGEGRRGIVRRRVVAGVERPFRGERPPRSRVTRPADRSYTLAVVVLETSVVSLSRYLSLSLFRNVYLISHYSSHGCLLEELLVACVSFTPICFRVFISRWLFTRAACIGIPYSNSRVRIDHSSVLSSSSSLSDFGFLSLSLSLSPSFSPC